MKNIVIRALVFSALAAGAILLLGINLPVPYLLPVVIPLGIAKPILNKFKQAIKSRRRLNNIFKWRC
jgi:small basic protein